MTASPKRNLALKICEDLKKDWRRAYGELERMPSGTARMEFAEKTAKEFAARMRNQLEKTGLKVLGPETAAADLSDSLAAGEQAWLFDPVVSSTNFARAHGPVGMALLWVSDKAKSAVVFNPLTDTAFVAETGSGAASPKRCRVEARKNLEGAVVAVESPLAAVAGGFAAQKIETRISGSPLADLMAVANGQLDAAVFSPSPALPHLFAELVMRESGGTVKEVSSPQGNILLAGHSETLKLLASVLS